MFKCRLETILMTRNKPRPVKSLNVDLTPFIWPETNIEQSKVLNIDLKRSYN